MLRLGQRILAGDVELRKLHVMQEHIDTAEVVSGDVDFLSKVAKPHAVFPKDALRFQEERTGTAGRVINLVDFRLSHRTETRQQFRHVGRREKFAAALSGAGRVHGHKELVSVAKGVDAVFGDFAKAHIRDAVEEF